MRKSQFGRIQMVAIVQQRSILKDEASYRYIDGAAQKLDTVL
jgi:hypothetical protein